MSYFFTALSSLVFGMALYAAVVRDRVRRLNVYYAHEMMKVWRRTTDIEVMTDKLKDTVYWVVIRAAAQGVDLSHDLSRMYGSSKNAPDSNAGGPLPGADR